MERLWPDGFIAQNGAASGSMPRNDAERVHQVARGAKASFSLFAGGGSGARPLSMLKSLRIGIAATRLPLQKFIPGCENKKYAESTGT